MSDENKPDQSDQSGRSRQPESEGPGWLPQDPIDADLAVRFDPDDLRRAREAYERAVGDLALIRRLGQQPDRPMRPWRALAVEQRALWVDAWMASQRDRAVQEGSGDPPISPEESAGPAGSAENGPPEPLV